MIDREYIYIYIYISVIYDNRVHCNAVSILGVVVKRIDYRKQCWCQFGQIECRSDIGGLFASFDLLIDGAEIFITMIIMLTIVILSILICSCGGLIYYYYQRHQIQVQRIHDEYINAAGWQPMDNDEQYPVDYVTDVKYMEAEKSQIEFDKNSTFPPPYTVFNSSYVAGQEQAK
jgi:hypothetical protein